MPEVLVVTKATIPSVEPERIEGLYEAAVNILKNIDGFYSMSGWMSDHSENDYLIIAHFASEEAAESGANALLEADVLLRVVELVATPIDSNRIRILASGGIKFDEIGRHGLLSYSLRTADPGMGPATVLELSDVLKNLNAIDGFLGWASGCYVSNEEEIAGFAYWKTRQAFSESLPNVILYKVLLYERVF